MTIEQFIQNSNITTCSDISQLCVKHMFNKVYQENQDISQEELIDFLSNYSNYKKYLNDYAGTIYNRYSSSLDSVYIEICNLFKIDIDNQYTLEHVIVKLEKQEPSNILNLTQSDIQEQLIENFEEKLKAIELSKYYNNNKDKFLNRVETLKRNIQLVKSALQI